MTRKETLFKKYIDENSWNDSGDFVNSYKELATQVAKVVYDIDNCVPGSYAFPGWKSEEEILMSLLRHLEWMSEGFESLRGELEDVLNS